MALRLTTKQCMLNTTRAVIASAVSPAGKTMGKRSGTTPNPSNKKAKSSAAQNDARSGEKAAPDVEECGFDPAELPKLRAALLSWYDANHRTLPWRRNLHSQLSATAVASATAAGQLPAPSDLPQDRFIYYVWVCEIMSQQTQVARAAEYFRRWVARWPDVAALAAASQEEVNEVWAGLGYYRRARYLLDGARYIVAELGGEFPRTAKDLQRIPGVGPYTAAAIASIACGERAAVVDGNVVRVLARLRRIGGDPRSLPVTRLFAELAASALDPARPGDFNQAVMELGATVCVPNTHPACGDCPVSSWCTAWQEERQGSGARVTDYPAKVQKAEKREESVAVAVIQLLPRGAKLTDPGAGAFLLVKRPPGGLLAGLWEFPLLPVEAEASAEEARSAVDAHLAELLNVRLVAAGGAEGAGAGALLVVQRKPLGEVVHVFSHIRMTMRVELLVLQGDQPTPSVAPGSSQGQREPVLLQEAAVEEPAGAAKPGSKRSASAAQPAGGGVPADMQWLSGEEVGAKGLSSGVKKVFKLYTDSRAKAAGGIAKFFKPTKVAMAAAT